MHPPLPHQSVTPPLPRQEPNSGERSHAPRPPEGIAADDGREASMDDSMRPMRSQGLVGDFGPIVEQTPPDWDWGPDDERRRN